MRTSKILLISLALALVAVGATAAFALAKDGHAADAPPARHHDNETDENETAEHANESARHAERESARDNLSENRTAALEAFFDAMEAQRASFAENKTRVLDACHADNATAHNESERHCVRDGMKPVLAQHRHDLRAALDALHDALSHARWDFWHGWRHH